MQDDVRPGVASPATWYRRTSGKRRLSDTDDPSHGPLATERLPARMALYRSVPRVPTASAVPSEPLPLVGVPEPTAAVPLALAPPPTVVGSKTCEYALLRPLLVVRCSATLPDTALLDAVGAEGWLSAEGTHVLLRSPADVLQLVDDDKLERATQAFLPDLFLRHTLRQAGSTHPYPL